MFSNGCLQLSMTGMSIFTMICQESIWSAISEGGQFLFRNHLQQNLDYSSLSWSACMLVVPRSSLLFIFWVVLKSHLFTAQKTEEKGLPTEEFFQVMKEHIDNHHVIGASMDGKADRAEEKLLVKHLEDLGHREFIHIYSIYNLVFRWPKPLFFMVLGAHGLYIYIDPIWWARGLLFWCGKKAF